MKKIKTVILITTMVITGFVLGRCAFTIYAAQDNSLKIWYENSNGAVHTYCLVDDITGVNYVVVSTERGNGEYSIAISPRYNSDGSLYSSK